MAKTVEAEFFLLVDSDGKWTVCESGSEVADKHEEAHGSSLNALDGFRIVRVKVVVPVPEIADLVGVVPAEGAATLSVGG